MPMHLSCFHASHLFMLCPYKQFLLPYYYVLEEFAFSTGAVATTDVLQTAKLLWESCGSCTFKRDRETSYNGKLFIMFTCL